MRIVLCFLLALVASPAWAAWVPVTESESGDSYYIDPATIRVNGNLRRIWILINQKVPHPDGELSARTLQEFDCKEDRLRILAGFSHSGPMATGKVLLTVDKPPLDWHHVPPSAVFATILKFSRVPSSRPDFRETQTGGIVGQVRQSNAR